MKRYGVEALSAEDIDRIYPWRVQVRSGSMPLREDGVDRTHEAREWCSEKFDPIEVDRFHPTTSPVPPALPRWHYRYEMGEIDENNMVSFYDVFYFQSEDDAFEFKIRWG